MEKSFDTDVLIVGAGPTGATLAADLLRRGIKTRIIEKGLSAFTGSRAKGIQPRTQEVLEDLGLLKEALALGSEYPKMGIHIGPFTLPFSMHKKRPITSDIPYPNILLLPQYRTDQLLHRNVEKQGVKIEFGTTLISHIQNEDGVIASLSTGEHIYCNYLIGADGGASTIRKSLNIPFIGETNEADRMIIIDGTIPKLKRNRWHIWPKVQGKQIAACPLPSSEQFQVMIRLAPKENILLENETLSKLFFELTGFSLKNITWTSLFRPNVRLAKHYRDKRVFIVGDAAHVHTPAGAQGLNTGIQDAYNLGWKLGQVLSGTNDSLLDSYEGERQPIAAHVLKLSDQLYNGIEKNKLASLKRGDEERQLGISYFGGPLTSTSDSKTKTLRTGDRAPDAILSIAGSQKRLFELMSGPHFTLLAFGKQAIASLPHLTWSSEGAELICYSVDENDISDFKFQLHQNYGITDNTLILIRPDGYIGGILTEDFVSNWPSEVKKFIM